MAQIYFPDTHILGDCIFNVNLALWIRFLKSQFFYMLNWLLRYKIKLLLVLIQIEFQEGTVKNYLVFVSLNVTDLTEENLALRISVWASIFFVNFYLFLYQ